EHSSRSLIGIALEHGEREGYFRYVPTSRKSLPEVACSAAFGLFGGGLNLARATRPLASRRLSLLDLQREILLRILDRQVGVAARHRKDRDALRGIRSGGVQPVGLAYADTRKVG